MSSNYKHEFIQLAIKKNALQFGNFTLKSGRISPYFFNAGLLSDGECMTVLGRVYAACLLQHKLQFDTLFGPAYKGIPLVASLSIALFAQGINAKFGYNRKEKKNHGEGGCLVGDISGNVLLVDDVITAGTAVRESLATVSMLPNVKVIGVIVALDRQEKGNGELSTVQELAMQEECKVVSVVTLSDILEYIQDKLPLEVVEQMRVYQRTYGTSNIFK